MGEVVFAEGEEEFGLGDAPSVLERSDETDMGDAALCGNGEDGIGTCEEKFAEVARCGCALAEVVVADEEEGGLGVVESIAEDVVEVAGCCDATIRHEMVDIVNDDEGRTQAVNVALDFAYKEAEVLAEDSKDVEAHEVELAFIEMEGVFHLLIELGAGVGAVERVYPEDGVGGGLAGGTGLAGGLNGVHFEGGGLGVIAGKNRAGNHLGEVVGVAGVAAG